MDDVADSLPGIIRDIIIDIPLLLGNNFAGCIPWAVRLHGEFLVEYFFRGNRPCGRLALFAPPFGLLVGRSRFYLLGKSFL